MKIGILSDTHAVVGRTRELLKLLAAEKVEAVLHCGDIGCESILHELVAAFGPAGVPIHAVLGNVDFDDCSCAGVTIHGRFADLKIGGRRLAIIHGDDYRGLQEAASSGRFDFVFTGHTHQRDDRTVGTTRIINPGAVQRTHEPGGAVLDLKTGKLRYIDL